MEQRKVQVTLVLNVPAFCGDGLVEQEFGRLIMLFTGNKETDPPHQPILDGSSLVSIKSDYYEPEIKARVDQAPDDMIKPHDWTITEYWHDGGMTLHQSLMKYGRLEFNEWLMERAYRMAAETPNDPSVSISGINSISLCIGVYKIKTWSWIDHGLSK